ncbi:aminotransferase class I/II-fold pyridoxal phosphate-dependent enzyme [Cohnella hongkongensis]|uniref:Aminotransferase class I/II-fold pyridoxal phosphate-dependent enzyme n=1 Tax=Cohnella hongkongensis TaxID=178337 RepID=A0ABV9FEW4_9BACL
MQNKHKAPLFEALVAHDRLRAAAFHVPGHKSRAAWGDERAAAYYSSLLPLDVTELSDTDDLHHPQGPLLEAQALAADCFGAEETRFLAGGSTSGNLAMILGLCRPGDLIVVQRNVHKSIIHGLMLAGARAVLLSPEIDEASGLATVPGERLVAKALERYPEAKALILSSPNYYGMSPDLTTLIAIAHGRGIPALVDEAHGAHYGFHPRFPRSALRSGADIVVQSTHKMLGALTMGAMLHMQGERIPRSAVRQALTMVQSSSPSFPILASLDLARRQLHTSGEHLFSDAIEALEHVLEALERTPFRALGYGRYASADIAYDPLKLVLFDETGTFDGFALRDALEEHRCIAEMADEKYAVLALGPGTTQEDGRRLKEALLQLASRRQKGRPEGRPEAGMSGRRPHEKAEEIAIPEPVEFDREERTAITVPLERSVGRKAAEWVIPYPPGIPALFPGETITKSLVGQLLRWRHEGARIQGIRDPQLLEIQVWQDNGS